MMRIFMSAVAALALLACSPQAPEAPAPQASDIATPTVQTGGKDAAQTPGLTAELLIGRWGDNGDCTKDVTFHADGTFSSYTGGAGNWVVRGDGIIMSGLGGTFQLGISVVNRDALVIANPDGSIGTSQRCP